MTDKGIMIAVDRNDTLRLIFENLLHRISLSFSERNLLRKQPLILARPSSATQSKLEKGIYKGRKCGVWYRSIKLFALGIIALSLALVGIGNALAVTLTVNMSTDNPNSYPGGQTISSGATTGDLRYCINYILNEQAQGVAQDYQIIFAPGINLIQLQAKLSVVNLLGSDTIVIGNSDPATPVTITGSSSTSGLFIRQGTVILQNLNLQNFNATGGSGGDGGGGGMGAGGALFIDTANVTLHNINFSANSAIAGLGGGPSGSGGGGVD